MEDQLLNRIGVGQPGRRGTHCIEEPKSHVEPQRGWFRPCSLQPASTIDTRHFLADAVGLLGGGVGGPKDGGGVIKVPALPAKVETHGQSTSFLRCIAECPHTATLFPT